MIEHLITHTSDNISPHFYRTLAGAELDLVLEASSGIQADEAKLSLSPTLTKGYHLALADLNIPLGYVVYSCKETYQMTPNARITSLADAITKAC